MINNVSRHYNQPNDVPEANPDMTTALANLATATGADRTTVAALTKSLAELTAVTKAQAGELRRLIRSGHIAPLPAQAQHGSATVARVNGRQHRSGKNEQVSGSRPLYKTKNKN
jgi:type IV secretory pathway VirJ component